MTLVKIKKMNLVKTKPVIAKCCHTNHLIAQSFMIQILKTTLLLTVLDLTAVYYFQDCLFLH